MSIAVAIDGPAGSGKSTIAKLLAKKYGIMYINTGAMYRAVTLFALDRNIDYKDCKGLCNLIDSLSMHFDGDRLLVNGEDVTDKITLPRVSENVSNYSIIPEVRERLVKLQQKIADKYSVVMDGRDIGTVVLKDADVKFFLTADSGERARRRFEELQIKGIDKSYDEILENIKQRDYIDSNRKASPLKQSEDAILIDSTSKTIEQVVETMAEYINKIKEVKKSCQ